MFQRPRGKVNTLFSRPHYPPAHRLVVSCQDENPSIKPGQQCGCSARLDRALKPRAEADEACGYRWEQGTEVNGSPIIIPREGYRPSHWPYLHKLEQVLMLPDEIVDVLVTNAQRKKLKVG